MSFSCSGFALLLFYVVVLSLLSGVSRFEGLIFRAR
jgi:hypothetical protein